MSGLPQEIEHNILCRIIDSMIWEASTNKVGFGMPELVALLSRVAQQILDLRYISRHAARDVMFICWKRFEKIYTTNQFDPELSTIWYIQKCLLADCLRGWLQVGPSDDFLLTKARRVVETWGGVSDDYSLVTAREIQGLVFSGPRSQGLLICRDHSNCDGIKCKYGNRYNK